VQAGLAITGPPRIHTSRAATPAYNHTDTSAILINKPVTAVMTSVWLRRRRLRVSLRLAMTLPTVPPALSGTPGASYLGRMQWWQVLITVLGGLLLPWVALIGALAWSARGQEEKIKLVDALRLGPDVMRLTRRLATDATVPRGVRVWLVVLLIYLLSPIDLVPDFIPVIGYADDAIIVALVLRFATRHAGAAALDRHWPGSPQGLAALRTVVGLR
jgi:uncharacterized membrane protein YkvA (DUF1232 family)